MAAEVELERARKRCEGEGNTSLWERIKVLARGRADSKRPRRMRAPSFFTRFSGPPPPPSSARSTSFSCLGFLGSEERGRPKRVAGGIRARWAARRRSMSRFYVAARFLRPLVIMLCVHE